MNTLNKTNSFESFLLNTKSRQSTNLRKIIIMILLGISCTSLHAQWIDYLPELSYPLGTNYDFVQGAKGHFFNINYGGSTPEDKAIWSLAMNQKERYRFCQNGTFAFLNPTYGKHRIGFYASSLTSYGMIEVSKNDFNIIGVGNVNMFSAYKTTDSNKPALVVGGDAVSSNKPFEVRSNKVNILFSPNEQNNTGWIGTFSNSGLHLGTNNNALFFIDTSQRVYVGMTKADANKVKAELRNKYYMFVTKGILAEDFAIAPKSTWADYVFNKDYNLRGLNEVEEFISENNHLPDVPSAKQVADEGYSQHDMNKALLQKIEELTLYVIKQEKKIATLESELDNLKK